MNRSALESAHRLPGASCISVDGLWGRMIEKSVLHWMLNVNEDVLLDGFRKRPGIQAWIGEHLGKFLLGAIPTSRMIRNDELSAKVARLCEAMPGLQEPDGYMGTYREDQRWADNNPSWNQNAWDVWVHKYCILALLEDYAGTRRQSSLNAAVRAADALLAAYGPGRKDINRSSTHVGLASGSVMEPIMRLYQVTGEKRFLDFAEYFIASWEKPDGPGIITHLRAGHSVERIANGKAYEMMSCFVGLVEYCRSTGNGEILQMLLDARDRIADTQRLPTGAMSRGEVFTPPGILEEYAEVETCVTFTWIQFNLRLFEVTGDARALDLAEEAAWNQLLPALSPNGNTWSYFLPLTGPKRFIARWVQQVDVSLPGAAVSCCHTNGQRGLALLPQYIYTIGGDGALAVNFYCASTARVDLPDGAVTLRQETDFPVGGKVTIDVQARKGRTVRLSLRRPVWTSRMTVDGREAPASSSRVGVTVSGKQDIKVDLEMSPRLILCGLSSRGKCAMAFGPLVLSMENPPNGLELDQVALDLGTGDWKKSVSAGVEEGWPVLDVPFVALPHRGVFDGSSAPAAASGNVRLRPVLAAGLKGNRTLAELLGNDDIPADPDEARRNYLPEYRVLLPYFWRPAAR